MSLSPTRGQRFGRWTFVAKASGGLWRLQCDCGTTKDVDGRSVRRGYSRSCGCLYAETRRSSSLSHGMSRSPEYAAWHHMIERCTQPNHKSWAAYGGRGINVCDRWRSFESFLADMGKRPSPQHSIDRIDNDGGYEPGNCRWATTAEQQRNTSRTKIIEFGGKAQCLTDWAAERGLTKSALIYRLDKGWPVDRALTTPLRVRGAA
jgi:hypothetical protein